MLIGECGTPPTLWLQQWLMNSVSPSIARMIEAIANAAAIWKKLSNMYSGAGNVMMMMVQSKVDELKQGEKRVQEYASKLQQLWSDLDHYDPLQLTCSSDIEAGEAWQHRRRVTHSSDFWLRWLVHEA